MTYAGISNIQSEPAIALDHQRHADGQRFILFAFLCQAFTQAWAAVSSNDGWTSGGRNNNVDMFTKSVPGSSVNCCKGGCLLIYPAVGRSAHRIVEPELMSCFNYDGHFTRLRPALRFRRYWHSDCACGCRGVRLGAGTDAPGEHLVVSAVLHDS